MKKKEIMIPIVVILLELIVVIALISLWKNSQVEQKDSSGEDDEIIDVLNEKMEDGITDILNETIISAELDASDPFHPFQCDDVSEAVEILRTLEDGVFTLIEKPKHNKHGFDAVVVVTTSENNTYRVGQTTFGFMVSKNEEYSYYQCSVRNVFMGKFLEFDDKYMERTEKSEVTLEFDPDEGMIIPVDSSSPEMFETEEELIRAVQSNVNDIAALEGLNEFYRMKNVPDNYSLEYIKVADTYVTLRYHIANDENYTEDSEKYYLISWYRTMEKIEDLDNEMLRMYTKDHVYQKNYRDYMSRYIISEETWQDVFWVQDRKSFHAVVPLDLTNEEIAYFCNAEKVMINK